jgi:hypothetical protein
LSNPECFMAYRSLLAGTGFAFTRKASALPEWPVMARGGASGRCDAADARREPTSTTRGMTGTHGPGVLNLA